MNNFFIILKKSIRYVGIVLIVLVLATMISLFFYNLSSNYIEVEAASAFYPYAVEYFQNNDIFSSSKIDVKLVSTTQAYRDIIEEKTDIVVASGPSDEQRRMIEKANVELEYEILYLEPLDIIVSKENETENLSIEDIQRIYNSNDLNWNTYQLEKNNGSQTCFESIVKNNKIRK